MPRSRPRLTHETATAQLARLTALEAALTKLSGARGLAEAPQSLVRLTHDLLAETRTLFPARDRRTALPVFPGVSRAAKRGHPAVEVRFAELAVLTGQARAVLAAYVAANGLDKPPAGPDPHIEALREKLAARIEQLVDERDAARAAARAAEEATAAASPQAQRHPRTWTKPEGCLEGQ